MSRIVRPWLWPLLVGLLAYVAQLFPIPGIFLMMMGAILWPGACLHLAMVLLVLDVWRGRTTKILLIAPLLFYGAGLWVWASNYMDGEALAGELAASDMRASIPFNPTQQAIVVEEG